MKPVKLCHFMLLDATSKEIHNFSKVMGPLKDKINKGLDYDIEFLLTNQDVKLMDLKYLIEHLTILYDKYKELRADKLNKIYNSSEEDNDTKINGDKNEK